VASLTLPSPMLTAFRWLWLLAVFAGGAWLQARGTLPSVLQYWPDVLYLSRQHLWLVLISGSIALAIGLPLGIFLTRESVRPFANAVTQVVNLGTTIPTLAILALAMSILGIGTPSAVFGLVALTLLPIVLNSVAGLRMVPRYLIEAARGMGMTGGQILFQVELPNAVFVILGLGELIFTGIDLMEPSMLLAGAIPTALLAILVDFLVGQIQYWLIPRGINPLR
jgi:osmoprotectant transport system permease protein